MHVSDFLYLILQVVILCGSYFIGRYIIPITGYTESINDVAQKFNLMVDYADKFVAWAKYFMKSYTGSEKMEAVVTELVKVAEKYDIDISRTEIIAIAQKAYDNMMAGITEAENAKKIADVAQESNKNAAKIVIPNTTIPSEIDPGIYDNPYINNPNDTTTPLPYRVRKTSDPLPKEYVEITCDTSNIAMDKTTAESMTIK